MVWNQSSQTENSLALGFIEPLLLRSMSSRETARIFKGQHHAEGRRQRTRKLGTHHLEDGGKAALSPAGFPIVVDIQLQVTNPGVELGRQRWIVVVPVFA